MIDRPSNPPLRVRTLTRALRHVCLGAALLAGGFAAGPALATQLVQKNLTRLIAGADVIVSGRVKSVTDGIDNGVPYTEVTISVASSAKKKLAPRSDFKFRQFGLLNARKLPSGKFLVATAPEGFATFHADEQVIAFLVRPAAKTGLRSTVGLEQGKFTTMGGRTANAQFNRNLFAGVQVSPSLLSAAEAQMLKKPAGEVDAAVLMSLVNRAVAGRWIETGVMR
jgi:hypothetical protein